MVAHHLKRALLTDKAYGSYRLEGTAVEVFFAKFVLASGRDTHCKVDAGTN